MTAPANDPARKNWKAFLAHRDDVRIDNIDLFKDFAVSVEKSQALTHLRVHNFKTGTWTPSPSPSRSTPHSRRHAGVRIHHLPLQVPEPDHALQHLRLRHPQRKIHALEAAGSARRVRPEAVRQRAPVGHGARRRQGADLHRVQEGPGARRQGAALPLRLRLLRIRHAAHVFQPAPEPAGSRHVLRHRAHPRRRRDGRKMARRRHAHEEEEHLLRLHRLRRISDQGKVDCKPIAWSSKAAARADC